MVLEDRISAGFPLIGRVAGEFVGKLPAGVTLDDLVSLGGEQLMKASEKYDPADGRPWLGYLTNWLRFSFRDYLRSERKRAARQREFEPQLPSGGTAQRADPKAEEPSDRAASREMSARGRRAVCMAAAESAAPPPDEVAEKAAVLRAAMFDSVGVSDVRAAMQAVAGKAASGDLRAVRLLFELLGTRIAQPSTQQQVAVFLPPATEE